MTRSDAAGARTQDWIDGVVLCALVAAGSRAVDTNRDRINALNVFPVPDGDTGTNMSLTLKTIVEETTVRPELHVGEVAQRMARAALLAARGNSGLISAQLFRGLADAAAGRERISPSEFAAGMHAGARAAYDSVPDPREGTMLTVMRVTAEAASAAAESGGDIAAVLEAASVAAIEAVAFTPTQLDVLRDAGVVDSGGYGLSVFLSGALEQAQGRGNGASEFLPPSPIRVEGGGLRMAGVRSGFVEAAQDTVYGYCTVFVIEGEGLEVVEIRDRTTEFGESAVVAGDSALVKIHVHPLDPGPVISYGAGLGTLSGITILNMDEQTADWAAGQRQDAAPAVEWLETAIVAVCVGPGIKAAFVQAGMGACIPVAGGDTMNPSVRDLLDAVEAAPSDQILLLPNNKNILAAALQVPQLSDKAVRVVSTTSIPAGIAAAFAFSTSTDLEANVAAMSAAAEGVRSGSVTRAVRDAGVSGQKVLEGEFMALLDGALVATAGDPLTALVEMVRSVVPHPELITIYSGADVRKADVQKALEAARRAAGTAEVELVPGGQPHYDFLVAFE